MRPPPLVEAAEGRLLYMVAWEVASIAKTYKRINKYALNMYVRAYISYFLVKSLLSNYHPTEAQACKLVANYVERSFTWLKFEFQNI